MGKLFWTPPENMVADSEIKHYIISYALAGSSGKTKKVTGNSTYVTDLASGLQYDFKIKMVTTHGDTDYSNGLLVTAPSNVTELEKLQEALNEGIDKLEDDLEKRIGKIEDDLTALQECTADTCGTAFNCFAPGSRTK